MQNAICLNKDTNLSYYSYFSDYILKIYKYLNIGAGNGYTFYMPLFIFYVVLRL